MVLISGNDTSPETLAEQRFSIFSMLVGIIGVSVLVGMATVSVGDFDVMGRKRQEQIDAILMYLRYRRVPHDVRNQIM